MKKKIIVLGLIVTMISGCGSKIPTLSNGDEAVVTLKDDSKISANELYEKMKSDHALTALINMVDKKILEEKYSDKLEEAKNHADTQMTQLEQQFGEQLEQAIQYYTGGQYQTKDAYKEYIYLSYLQNLAVTDYAKDQITDKEIKKYYKDEIVGDIKVSHILITPEVKDDMTDDEKTAAQDEAKNKVQTIINELKGLKGSELEEKFAEKAKENSSDDSTKENGGSLGFINKDTLSSSYDELVTAAYKLKDGEMSTDVITTELGYHIILRTESKEKADLEDVKDKILDALSEKYTSENPVSQVKALQELRKSYDLEIVDSDLKTKYATYIQNQLNYYNQSTDENNDSSSSES